MTKIKKLNVRLKNKSIELPDKKTDIKSIKTNNAMKITKINNNTNIIKMQTDIEALSNEIKRDYRRYSGMEV